MPIPSHHQQPLVKFVQKSCPFFSYRISLELCICSWFHMSLVSCSDNILNLTALPSNIILWHACVLFSGTRCCSLLWYKGMFPRLNSNMCYQALYSSIGTVPLLIFTSVLRVLTLLFLYLIISISINCPCICNCYTLLSPVNEITFITGLRSSYEWVC
jgi:hypothetical protein